MATRKSELVITCNAKAVKDVFEYLNRQLADVKQKLKDLNAKGEKSGWTEQMKKDFRDLTKQATAIDSAIIHNQQSMVKYGQVLKDLSGSKLKDLKSALREATTSLNKMSEKSPGRQKLIDDIKRIKDQISGTSGLTMSFRQAQTQLKNLDNTSMDKLKQGLAAIKTQLDDPNIGNKWRRSLEQMQAQYQAAMAVRQAPITNRPVTTMNAAQLRAEQSAITSALAATQGVKGYEQKAAAYEQRLKAINTQLKDMAQSEKAADAAAKELQATQEASKVVQQVTQGQKVSLDQLTTAYRTLEAQASKYAGVNPAKYQQTQQAMKMLEVEIKKVKGELLSEKEIQDRIANSGKYSVKQLQEAYNQLQAKLQNLHTNEKTAIKQTRMQMKQLEKDIQRATGQVTGMAKAWQTAKQNIMMYVGVFAIVNKIKTTLSDLITKNKELSDSMANIRKVSQWASADVVKLTENLAKIDTRNTISTLQNLAYQGAKLGIGQYGVEGLTGFVRAAEQVQTALGEDLGEEALPALAKLTEVMGLIPKFGVEQAIQKAGSAIYQLGATSTATGKNIVEFSKRLMGLANVSGVTADELLGLGSAADSMALMPEVAATAFNKLFNSIHGNTEGIANAVGLAKEELEGLLYEGKTMEALVKVFEKMQQMSMKELEGRGVFKELGSDGARLTNVMITMSNKVDMLKSHLDVANEAFSEGKAVINEYLIQQETAAAYFERAGNIWEKAFVNPEGVDIVKQLAQEWYNVSWEMTHSVSTMTSIRTTLEMLAGTVELLIKNLPTLIKLMMFYGVGSVLQGIVTQFNAIYRASMLAGTGMARFNAILKTNAIALAATAVLMLVSNLYELSEASKAAAEEEEKRRKVFNDAAAEALQQYREQSAALNEYNEALKRTNMSEDERNEIINRFKNEFGSYLEKLGIEIRTYGDLEMALRRVNHELKQKAYYETAQKLRSNYVGDAQSNQTNALSKYMQAAQKYNIPTTVMEDIMEGRITDPAKAIQTVYNSLYGNQYGTNGKLNWIPGKPYQYWVGSESNVRNTVPTRGAVGWVMDKVTGGGATMTQEIYDAVTSLVSTTREVNTRNQQVDKFINQYAPDYSPLISIEGALNNLNKLSGLTEDKLNEGLNVLRDKWKGMTENQRADDTQDIKGAIDKYSAQLRKLRGEGYTPPAGSSKGGRGSGPKVPPELTDAKKEAEKQATAIIGTIEEFYRLQEAAANELAASGALNGEDFEMLVKHIQDRKDKMLLEARRAIVGDPNDFENIRKTLDADLMKHDDAVSLRAIESIQGVDIAAAAATINRFNGSDAVYGLDSRAFKNNIRKEAAQNELNIQRRQAAVTQEIDKILLQYQFVEQSQRDLGDKLVTLGLITDGYQKVVKQLADGTKITANSKEVSDFAAKVVGMGSRLYSVNPENVGELQKLMYDAMTTVGENGLPAMESFAKIFPNFDKWMQQPQQYKEEMQAMYELMLQYEGIYYDKLKQRDDLQNKRLDSWWEHSDEKKENDQDLRNAKIRDFQFNTMYEGQNMGYMMGLTNDLTQDPEVLREQAILEAKIAIWRKAEEERKAGLISEEVYQQRLRDMQDQTIAYTQTVMQNIQKRIDRLHQFAKPVEQFAGNVGKKLGEMIKNIQDQSMTWNEIFKDMELAVAEAMLNMAAEYAKQVIVQKAMNKERVADEAATATAVTMLGISEASAKTLGTLGWIGIALIPIITSLLMGLLQGAISSANKSSESTSAATPKTKLVSSMLTYDKGNVQRFIGQDGKVYTATEEPQPKDGLITHPIATTVQGQPALVAEKGPEIVIGREATRAIMMNEPELIRYLANYQQQGGRRLFDDGNLPSSETVTSGSAAGTDAEMRQTMNEMREVMAGVLYYLQNPIPPEIAMYDRGGKKGLHTQIKEADRFMARYGG